jgi:hypothetical protein
MLAPVKQESAESDPVRDPPDRGAEPGIAGARIRDELVEAENDIVDPAMAIGDAERDQRRTVVGQRRS